MSAVDPHVVAGDLTHLLAIIYIYTYWLSLERRVMYCRLPTDAPNCHYLWILYPETSPNPSPVLGYKICLSFALLHHPCFLNQISLLFFVSLWDTSNDSSAHDSFRLKECSEPHGKPYILSISGLSLKAIWISVLAKWVKWSELRKKRWMRDSPFQDLEPSESADVIAVDTVVAWTMANPFSERTRWTSLVWDFDGKKGHGYILMSLLNACIILHRCSNILGFKSQMALVSASRSLSLGRPWQENLEMLDRLAESPDVLQHL